MAARVCFLREQHAGDAVFAMATRAPCASMPRDPIARVARAVAAVKNAAKLTRSFPHTGQQKKYCPLQHNKTWSILTRSTSMLPR